MIKIGLEEHLGQTQRGLYRNKQGSVAGLPKLLLLHQPLKEVLLIITSTPQRAGIHLVHHLDFNLGQRNVSRQHGVGIVGSVSYICSLVFNSISSPNPFTFTLCVFVEKNSLSRFLYSIIPDQVI